jgi:hypothetical protein
LDEISSERAAISSRTSLWVRRPYSSISCASIKELTPRICIYGQLDLARVPQTICTLKMSSARCNSVSQSLNRALISAWRKNCLNFFVSCWASTKL